jgi:hypothetical protein
VEQIFLSLCCQGELDSVEGIAWRNGKKSFGPIFWMGWKFGYGATVGAGLHMKMTEMMFKEGQSGATWTSRPLGKCLYQPSTIHG